MKLSFPRYNNQFKNQLITLLGDAWFKRKLWDWQFLSANRPSWKPVIVTDTQGLVVGFNAVIPVKVYYQNDIVEAAWSCDFIVDSNLRGQGVGKKIKLSLHQHYPLLLSLGISDQAVRVLKSMNWKCGTSVINYRKRLNSSDAKGVLIRGIQLLNYLKAKFSVNFEIRNIYDSQLSSRLPDENKFESFFSATQKGGCNQVIRDYSYLEWRYLQHPLAKYDFISLWQENSLKCIAVIRQNDNQSVLVDYIGPANNIGLKSQLIGYWFDYSPNAEFMNCTTSDTELGLVFLSNGFRSAEQQRFYVHGESKSSANNWFIMGGDSDGDILQAAQGVGK